MLKKILVTPKAGQDPVTILDTTDLVTKNGTRGTVNLSKAHVIASQPLSDSEVATKRYVDTVAAGGANPDNPGSILPPVAITPNADSLATSQTVFTATPYRNAYEDNKRKERVFEIKKLDDTWEDGPVIRHRANVDSFSLGEDTRLENNTRYEWRCMDVSEWGYTSQWSNVQEFVTGKEYFVKTPSLTVSTPISETPTLKATAFAVSTGTDEHVSTDWRIVDQAGETVWEELNNKSLLEITVPAKILKRSTLYTFMVRFNAKEYDSSDWATVNGTTEDDFGHVNEPVVTVSGYPDAISVTPVLTGGEFSVTKGSDTHIATDWIIYNISQTEVVWSSTNDATNLTNIQVGAELEVDTSYILNVRYKGNRCGWSEPASVTFTTTSAPAAGITTPVLDISDDKAAVQSRFSAFADYQPNISQTDWVLRETESKLIVWSSLNDTVNKYSCVIDHDLTPGTKYTLETTFYTEDSVSDPGKFEFTASTDQEEFLHLKVTPGASINLSSIMHWYSSSQWSSFESEYKIYVDDEETSYRIFNDTFTVPNGDLKVKRLNTSDKSFPCLRFYNISWLVEVARPLPKMMYYRDRDYNINFDYFWNCTNLVRVWPAAYRNAKHVKFTNAYRAFYNCKKLEDPGKGIFTIAKNDAIYAHYCFESCTALKSIDKHTFSDFSKCTSYSYTFYNTGIENFDAMLFAGSIAATDFSCAFYNALQLRSVPARWAQYTGITSAASAFSGCKALGNADHAFHGNKTLTDANSCFYNNTNLTSADSAFEGCTALTSASYCFYNNTNLTSADSAFEGCTALTNASYCFQSTGLVSISDTFKGCTALTNANYTFSSCSKLKHIGNVFEGCTGALNALYCFERCHALNDIEGAVFKGCINIYRIQNCFYDCANLTSISGNVFEGCTGLNPWNDKASSNNENGYHNYPFNSCPKLTEVTGDVFKGCTSITREHNLFQGTNVTRIAGNIFEGCTAFNYMASYSSSYLFKNVSEIESAVFKDCTALTNVGSTFSGSIVLLKVAGSIFEGCTGLKVASSLFSGCKSLREVSVQPFKGCTALTNISNIFAGCQSLEVIHNEVFGDLPALTSASGVFSGSRMTDLNGAWFKNCTSLNDSGIFSDMAAVTRISGNIFEGCTSFSQTNGDLIQNYQNITEIVGQPFKNCGYTSISSFFTNWSSLTHVGDGLFEGCPITSASYVFSENKAIVDVGNFLAGCPDISDMSYAFNKCSALTTVHPGLFQNHALTRIPYCFQECTALITVPDRLLANLTGANVNAYRLFYNASQFSEIPDHLFEGSTGLYSLEDAFRSTNITAIPAGLFKDCTSLVDIDYIFYQCNSLLSVPSALFSELPALSSAVSAFAYCAALQTVGDDLFASCPKLSDVYQVFSPCVSLKTVGANTFSNCPSLTRGSYCFSGCSKLKTVGANTFSNCKSLTSANHAFNGCNLLSEIGIGTFSGCSMLSTVNRCFYSCNELAAIPEDTFKACSGITDFSYCFYSCAALGAIPVGLFADCTAAQNFESCFSGCTSLSSVPKDTFKTTVNVNSFSACFYNTGKFVVYQDLFRYTGRCTNYTSCFSNSKIAAVPAQLFKYCPANTDVSSCFRYCTGIKTLDKNVFTGSNIKNANYCFSNCEIVEISGDIFKDCTQCTDFTYVFANNKYLTTISGNIFENCPTSAFQYWNAYCPALKEISGAIFKNTGVGNNQASLWASQPEVISGNIFENCLGITDTSGNIWYNNFCNRVKRITGAIFKGCTNLTNCRYAIYYNTNLVEVGNVFEGVTANQYWDYMFDGCNNIEIISGALFKNSNIPTASLRMGTSKLTQITGNVFEGCTSITSANGVISGLSALTKVSGALFKNCTSLTAATNIITGCNRLTDVSGNIFEGCTKLATATGVINDCSELKVITGNIFEGCTSLSSGDQLTSLPKLTEISSAMFKNSSGTLRVSACPGLTTISGALYDGAPNGHLNIATITTINKDIFINNKARTTGPIFDGAAISELPEGILDHMPNITAAPSFARCRNLVAVPANLLANTRKITSVPDFRYCDKLEEIPEGFCADLELITSAASKFQYCSSLKKIGANAFSGCINLTDISYMFTHCAQLELIGADIFKGDVSITNASCAFEYTSSLKAIPATLISDSTNLLNCGSMFQYSGIEQIPEGFLKTNVRVTTCSSMFYMCGALKTVWGEFLKDNVAVTSVDSLFNGCYNLKVVPTYIFKGKPKLTSISNTFRDTGVVEIPSELFAGCDSITSVSSLFEKCKQLERVPDNAFTGLTAVTTMSSVFLDCCNLRTVGNSLVAGCDLLTTFQNIFQNCYRLSKVGQIFEGNSSITSLYCCFYYTYCLVSVPEDFIAHLTSLTDVSYMISYSGLRPELKINSKGITNASYFAYGTHNEIGNVYLIKGSTTANTFEGASYRNVNIVLVEEVPGDS